MFQIAYFDPADLMVWFDVGNLFSNVDKPSVENRGVSPEITAAAYGIVRGAFDTRAGLNGEVLEILGRWGPRATMSLLTLWHEQRHFLDHFLTNFGASRVRVYWQIRAQLRNLYMVVQDDGVLGLPLDVYADPVERDILGLGPKGAQYLQGIGNFLTERREMIQQDRKYGTNPVSELPVDGFCQLEALGSLAQIAGMGELLQWRTPDKFKHFEEPFTRFPYLFAIVSVMKASGLDVIESARGGPLPVVTLKPAYLISAVLLAALMCRRTGRPSAELLTSYLPAPRLAKILHQLASDGVKEVPTADDGSRPLIGLVGKYGIDP